MSANRVMKNISRFIEEKLGLKVNIRLQKALEKNATKCQLDSNTFLLRLTN